MILSARSLCKYTWEVILFIILTGKRYLRPNIWLKTADQAKSKEKIIKEVEAKKAHY